MSKTALVIGCTGQLSRYLIELLLDKKYKVYGLNRRTSTPNTERITHLLDKITLIEGDVTDEYSLIRALEISKPDKVFNLAAQSFVPYSFTTPKSTMEITGTGVLNVLNAIKTVNPKIRIVQMSSSEQFGKVHETPQKETTFMHPQSPYGISKLTGYWFVRNYRDSYGMFASNAIAFNFESPHRGRFFVTKKITEGIKKILNNEAKELRLGNIKAKRDFVFCGDTAKAVYMISEHTQGDDFIISTNETHSIEEFLELSFGYVKLKWQDYVVIDPKFFRPSEVDLLQGDYTKIKETLGWEPSVRFPELVRMMLSHDLSEINIEL